METTAQNTSWPGPAQAPGLASVVIPVHNRADLLARTLDSVFAQTYRPLEAVVVDDGSSDDSAGAAERWGADHSADATFSLRVIRKNPNNGAASARNTGAAASRGEYIQFFDSDDEMRPEKLSKSISVLKAKPDLDFAACDFEIRKERDGKVEVTRWELSKREKKLETHLRNICLNTPSAVYRREALRTIGPWAEELRAADDYEFCFRAMALLKGEWLNEVLYDVHWTPTSITEDTLKRGSFSGAPYVLACERIERECRRLGIYNAAIRSALCFKLREFSTRFAKNRKWQAYNAVTRAALRYTGTLPGIPLRCRRLYLRLRGKF